MGLFGSRKNSDDNRNFHIFEEAQQQAGENVQLVLRKSDLYPIHISPNFKRVLGVEPARMVDDVETLFRFASEEDYATIKRSIREWDGSGTLALNAEYCMPTDPQRRKHLRTTLSPVMNGVPFRNHHRRYARASDYRAA